MKIYSPLSLLFVFCPGPTSAFLEVKGGERDRTHVGAARILHEVKMNGICKDKHLYEYYTLSI